MPPKLIRVTFLLSGFVFIFILGVLVGSSLHRSNKESIVVYSSPDTKSYKISQSVKEEMLKSFSVAYNTTHLWSMRLADEDYYRIGRLLPCRTVTYVGGPKNESMNSCSQTTLNEFSVETTLQAQKWIYNHQNPIDCTNKKFAIINKYAWSGFGSTMHQILWAFGTAIADGRIAIYDAPGNWHYGSCRLGNPDCLFLPITNCTMPTVVDNKQTIRIMANIDHWYKPIHPPVFEYRSFNWYRSQLLFYLMRYNAETLAYVQHTIAQSFNPPSVDLHHPYIALYVRRSDKVRYREMSQAYFLQQYFDLFDADARRAKIKTVYINSEDDSVFVEFETLNKNKGGYYKLLKTQATRNVVFMSMMGMQPEERKKVILEFLTDLFIEANADLHVGTLTSNWCRVVDEMRLALGKMLPFYTPEHRLLVDV